MTCAQVKPLLSAYLDGAVTGKQMHSLDEHLKGCTGCREQYTGLLQTQALLARVGRAQVPEDLSLKLRLALSREAARMRRNEIEGDDWTIPAARYKTKLDHLVPLPTAAK